MEGHNASRRTRSLGCFHHCLLPFRQRERFASGVQQTLAAIEVARTIEIADHQAFAFALRSVLCSSKEEWDLFNKTFEAFWGDSQRRSGPASGEGKEPRFTTHRPKASSQALLAESDSEAPPAESEGKAVSGASAQQRLQMVDLSSVPHDDLGALEQISLRLFRKMSLRLSRRLKIKNLADRVDMRRTIRRSIPRGGDPIDLAFQARKPRKHRLVIFLDVSGSMNSYSLFLVRFAYALQKHFKSVNTFLFSTNVVEITDVLQHARLARRPATTLPKSGRMGRRHKDRRFAQETSIVSTAGNCFHATPYSSF